MGLFGRRRDTRGDQTDEQEPRDRALPVLTEALARRLRLLSRQSMAQAGLEVTVYADYLEDSSGREFGLDGLSRLVAGLPAKQWVNAVDDHVNRLLAVVDAPDEFDVPTEDLLARTYLRLYPASTLPEPDRWSYGREVLPGVLELLALDLPDAVGVYTDERVAPHGIDDLRRAGLANLRTVEAEERNDIQGVQVLLGESVYLASTLLILPEMVLRTTGEASLPNGVLAAAPSRNVLMYHVPRDGQVIGAIEAMANMARHDHESSVGPVTPHVYWWRDGTFSQITHDADDGGIAVHIEGDFAEVFTRLTGES